MRAIVIALMVLATASSRADVARPWIGIALAPGANGVQIKSVIDGTPGQQAGLLAGDEVLAIDGAPVRAPQELIARVVAKGIGTKIGVEISRGGKHMTFTLALVARPEALALARDHLMDKPAPSFALADAVGPHSAKLADLKGHVVVIEFWATWCGYCKLTRPTLTAWQAKYPSVRVLGISSDPVDELRKLSAEEKLGYTVARDPDDRLAATYLVPGLPTFIVIDATGIVRYVGVGAGEGINGVEPALKKLLP